MNILVLGGAGFMGSNLAIHLNNLGHKITVMDNMVRNGVENNLPRFKKYDIEFVRGDIRCPEDFNKLRGNFDIVLLLAAQPAAINYANPVFDITNNTMGVLNTLEYIRDSGAGLIFWSTNKCYSGQACNSVPYLESDSRYVWADKNHVHTGWSEIGFNENLSIDGKDRSIYGVSKAMADVLIQEWSDSYGIPSIINRFSCVSGPYQWGIAEQGWVAWFAIANMLELPIEVYGFKGKQVRDNLNIKDLCSLIEKQVANIHKYRGEVFNVGGGINNTMSLVESFSIIEELTSKKFNNINFLKDPRRADQIIYMSDITKVSKEFDWEPKVSPKEGYVDIIEWANENKKILEGLYK